jgi:hypothetical protein
MVQVDKLVGEVVKSVAKFRDSVVVEFESGKKLHAEYYEDKFITYIGHIKTITTEVWEWDKVEDEG